MTTVEVAVVVVVVVRAVYDQAVSRPALDDRSVCGGNG